LIVLGSIVTAIVVGGGATPASTSAAQRVIVCPLMRGVVIPCCGPPVSSQRQPDAVQPIVCCPPNALCRPGLTIGSSPNPSKSTGSVVISGTMLTAAAGTQIALWQRLPGQAQFKQMAQASTDASGGYSITRGAGHVQTNREWYVTAGAARSTTISQQVQAVVTLALRGRTLTGSVSPSHARERVIVERKSGSHWLTIARPRLSRRSRFAIRLPVPITRSVLLRAVLQADARNVLSISPSLKLGR
jgi:hypothetical protein